MIESHRVHGSRRMKTMKTYNMSKISKHVPGLEFESGAVNTPSKAVRAMADFYGSIRCPVMRCM